MLILILTVALAWALWSWLGTEEEWTPDALPEDTAPEVSQPAPPPGTGVQLTTGVLTITVRTSHGAAPPEATAGYLRGYGERVRTVDENGQVRFSDAPLGEINLVAHAPGYEDGEQRRYISAGVPVDVVIVLESPHCDGPAPGIDDDEADTPAPEAAK